MFDLVQIGLEVVGAKCDDAGAYECHLSNELGTETGICNVIVHKIYKPPHFSRQLNYVRTHHMFFTNPELSIYGVFDIKMMVILAFYNLFWFIKENPLKSDKFHGKSSSFVGLGFVKTSYELVIDYHGNHRLTCCNRYNRKSHLSWSDVYWWNWCSKCDRNNIMFK